MVSEPRAERSPTRNVEIVRESVKAFLAQDLERMFALMDPQLVVEHHTEVPDLEGTYRGRAEFLGMVAKLVEVFDDYRVEPLNFEGTGDQVAVLFREVARGRASGLEIDRRIVLLHTLSSGKISHIKAILDRRADPREVVGQT